MCHRPPIQFVSAAIRTALMLVMVLWIFKPVAAQIPFTSGPIPLCDTSTFTANVTGVGTLYPYVTAWEFSLTSLTINITSDHPQTLQIFLTSPQGTTLLLSEFNGAGGQNYTNTTSTSWGYPSIATGTAPFTGIWTPQGGNLNIFDYENANGIWTITVIDTACVGGGGGTGPGGTWTPGWFNGAGGGGFAFDFYQPQPTCWGWIPDDMVYLCPGETVNILSYYTNYGYAISILDDNWNYLQNATAVSEPGWYYVEAYDYWDGCYYFAYFEIITLPQVALGPDQVVEQCSSAGPVNLASLFTLTGITPVWSLNGAPITGAVAAAATVPGTYQLIGQNMGGCNDTALVTLSFTDDIALGPDQTVTICPGTSTDLTSLFNTTGYTVEWTFGGNVIPAPTNASDAGVYVLTASSGIGCSATAEVTLTVDAIAMLGADQTVDLCSNASLDLTTLYTTTGLILEWTLMGVPVADPTAVNVSGTYQLVASNGADCADTALVTVNFNTGPALGPDAEDVICAGASVDLNSYFNTAGLITDWTFSGNPVLDPAAADTPGQYTLIATDAGGCTSSAAFTLSISTGVVLGPDQAVSICPGTSTDLTSLFTTTGYTVEWSFNGNVIPAPTNASDAGVYMLTASSGIGCSATAEVTLTVDAIAMLGADQTVDLCSNASLDLTTLYTTTGLITDWTLMGGPVADPTAVNVSGTYQLVASNGADCADTALVTVNFITGPALGPDTEDVICAGASVDLNSYFNTAGLITDWTFSGIPVPDPSAADTPGQYTLIATDAGGCTSSAAFTLSISAGVVLGPDQTVTICPGTSTDLTSLFNTTGYTVEWTFGGNVIPAPTTASDAGVYVLTASSGIGCSATAEVTLTVDAIAMLGADQTVDLCSNASLDLTILYTTTGLITEWTLMGVPVADPTAVNVPGTYQLVASNGADCADTALVTVNFNTGPALGPDAEDVICAGASVDLNSYFNTAGLITDWTFCGNPVLDPAAADTPGQYTLIATDAGGCTSSALLTITVSSDTVLGPDQSITACDGTAVDLTSLYNTGTSAVEWSLNGIPVANPDVVTVGGAYDVLLTNAAGCTATAIATITFVPAPVLGPDQSASICNGSTFDLGSLISGNGLLEVWLLNGTAVVDPNVSEAGTYQLVVTNTAACTDTAVVVLIVNPNPTLGGDQYFTLCLWQTVDLSTAFPVSGNSATYTWNGQPVDDPTHVSVEGNYLIEVINANGCTAEATAIIANIQCDCVADFSHDVECMQQPVHFTLLADSSIIGAHWEFSGFSAPSTAIDPVVHFFSDGDVLVTLVATLSCGEVTVVRVVQVQDCEELCNIYIPTAFTPDDDTMNDAWGWYGSCIPEDFTMEVYDRWGEAIFTTNDPYQSWDGTFRGRLSPSGVYVYRVGYRFPDQKRKEVAGSVTLLR